MLQDHLLCIFFLFCNRIRNSQEQKSQTCFNYCLQLESLESELTADRESLRSAESLSTDLMKEKALLEKTLETLRENSERQVRTRLQEMTRHQ